MEVTNFSMLLAQCCTSGKSTEAQELLKLVDAHVCNKDNRVTFFATGEKVSHFLFHIPQDPRGIYIPSLTGIPALRIYSNEFADALITMLDTLAGIGLKYRVFEKSCSPTPMAPGEFCLLRPHPLFPAGDELSRFLPCEQSEIGMCTTLYMCFFEK